MKTIVSLSICLILMFTYILTLSANDDSCQIKPLESFTVSEYTGNILYTVEGEVKSLDGNLLYIQSMLFNGKVSPNGLHLANRGVENNVNVVRILQSSGEVLYVGAPSEANIRSLHWLNDERIIAFTLFREGRGGGNTEFGFGYFIVEPFNQEYTYYEPSRDSAFYTQIPDKAFVEGTYRLTYDGHYLFNSNRAIYNFEKEEALNLNNYRWGIPSIASHRLISVDHDVYRVDGYYPVYIYDFDSDKISQLLNFMPDTEIVDSYENSWSPDETYWFYTLEYSNSNVDSFRRIEYLDLKNGDIQQTCLGLLTYMSGEGELRYVSGLSAPDFAWSRNGRYLALMGAVEGKDINESFGLYLYDTETNNIYLVHQGDADIIGWMADVEN